MLSFTPPFRGQSRSLEVPISFSLLKREFLDSGLQGLLVGILGCLWVPRCYGGRQRERQGGGLVSEMVQSEHLSFSITKYWAIFVGGGEGTPSSSTLDGEKSSSVKSNFFPGIEALFPGCGWQVGGRGV